VSEFLLFTGHDISFPEIGLLHLSASTFQIQHTFHLSYLFEHSLSRARLDWPHWAKKKRSFTSQCSESLYVILATALHFVPPDAEVNVGSDHGNIRFENKVCIGFTSFSSAIE
jgi:hypothetical protein